MAYTLTSATDLDDLVDKLYTFATVTDGAWAAIYNEDLLFRQIAVENGNCHIAIGSRAADIGIDRGGGNIDAILSAALSTSLTEPGNRQYWNHPGSLVTTDGDVDRVRTNDLGEPPFNNVWFFSGGAGDPKYIHMVVQASGERYTHFSFGLLDKAGMTTPDCAFSVGVDWDWHPDGGVDSNNPGSNKHDLGHLGGTQSPTQDNNLNVLVPASVLPVGFQTTPAVFLAIDITGVMERGRQDSDHWNNQQGNILDNFLPVGNQLITGGTIMWGIPWFFQNIGSSAHVFIGLLPGIRIANIADATPADILKFGTEDWVIFPWVRKGIRDNAFGGGSPIDLANTLNFGFAYKKNV